MDIAVTVISIIALGNTLFIGAVHIGADAGKSVERVGCTCRILHKIDLLTCNTDDDICILRNTSEGEILALASLIPFIRRKIESDCFRVAAFIQEYRFTCNRSDFFCTGILIIVTVLIKIRDHHLFCSIHLDGGAGCHLLAEEFASACKHLKHCIKVDQIHLMHCQLSLDLLRRCRNTRNGTHIDAALCTVGKRL